MSWALHSRASFQVGIHFFMQTSKCDLWEMYSGPWGAQNTTAIQKTHKNVNWFAERVKVAGSKFTEFRSLMSTLKFYNFLHSTGWAEHKSIKI